MLITNISRDINNISYSNVTKDTPEEGESVAELMGLLTKRGIASTCEDNPRLEQINRTSD